MTPRDAAILGFRLLAMYLFVDAIYQGAATTLTAVRWLFEDLPDYEEISFTGMGAMIGLAKTLQSLVVGFWLWFDAPRASAPFDDGAGSNRYVARIGPPLVLAIASCGALKATPAVGDLVKACQAAYWFGKQRSPFSDMESILREVATFDFWVARNFLIERIIAYALAVALIAFARPIAGVLLRRMPDAARQGDTPTTQTA